MPELPEVESQRRLAHAALAGKRIASAQAGEDPIVFDRQSADAVVRHLRGRRVVDTGRRGKYQWLVLDQAPHLILHFGMTGWFHFPGPGEAPPRWCRLELATSDGLRLALTDPRRLGRIRLSADPLADPAIARLGFDPLLETRTPAEFHAEIVRRNTPIKAVLLDQRFAAGVGNWIADEVLYQAGIAPMALASALAPKDTASLRRCLHRIVERAVEVGADDTRFPSSWLFHHRWGKKKGAAVATGQTVAFCTVAGRTTAWVPERQRIGAPL